jgi:CheY-like chemotaxis protein
MSIWQGILRKLGLEKFESERHSISVFLLDDDKRRHKWFTERFKGDNLDIAEDVEGAIDLLSQNFYDAIFLDHDLLPEHYKTDKLDDENTGYAVALWLCSRPDLQRASTIIVHTRNADGAMRMIEKMRLTGRKVEYVPFPMLAQKIKHYWQR